MTSKRSSSRPASHFPLSLGKTVLQAWNLFTLSAAFAILFNTFYAGGIELKAQSSAAFRPVPVSSAPLSYPGWKKTPSDHSPIPAAKVPSENYKTLTRISLSGAKNRFDLKKALFLDARSAEKYREGHIPGAINFSAMEMDQFAPRVMPLLTDKTREIVCYCDGGDCTLSLELAQTLAEQGFQKVEVFEGGWPEWKKASYPAVSGEAP